MRGEICLQGGAEFRPGCEAMDRAMLTGAGGVPRRVLVLPFAGRPGREREIAAGNARRWYAGLGAEDVEVVLDEAGSLVAPLGRAELVVLPGGSPGLLLEALRPHLSDLDAANADGTAISGSSAGAMVLCRWTVLPAARPRVVAALGLVPVDLVLPHYRGDGGGGWLAAARAFLPADPLVLGLPERSGVVIRPDQDRQAVGVDPVLVLT